MTFNAITEWMKLTVDKLAEQGVYLPPGTKAETHIMPDQDVVHFGVMCPREEGDAPMYFSYKLPMDTFATSKCDSVVCDIVYSMCKDVQETLEPWR